MFYLFAGIAFEVMLGDDDSTHHHKAPPKRLSSVRTLLRTFAT